MWHRKNLDYVTFPRWPEDGCDWIHPEDSHIAKRLLPGGRVFVHRQIDSEYQLYEYGDESFRALPRMQKRVEGDGLLIGDRVEVRSRLGHRRPQIATICDMIWDSYNHRIDYRLRYRQLSSRLPYASKEFQRIIPSDLPPVEQEITVSIPSDDDSDYQILPLENQP